MTDTLFTLKLKNIRSKYTKTDTLFTLKLKNIRSKYTKTDTLFTLKLKNIRRPTHRFHTGFTLVSHFFPLGMRQTYGRRTFEKDFRFLKTQKLR